MAIIETVDESLFIRAFEDYKRVVTEENKNGNFTYEGLRHLYAYLDDLSESMNEPLELDVITLCCDYAQYEDLNEYLSNYYNPEKIKDLCEDIKEGASTQADLNEAELQEFKEHIEEEINDNTTLIKFSDDLDDGFIIQAY